MEDRRRSPSRPKTKRIPLLLLRRGRFSQLDLQKRERRKVRVREIDGAALLDRTFLLFFFGNWQVNGREKGEKRNFKVKEEGVGEGSRKGGGGGLEGDKGGSVGRTDGPNLKRVLLPLPTPSPPGVSYKRSGKGQKSKFFCPEELVWWALPPSSSILFHRKRRVTNGGARGS